jgi:hypothetical protein
MGISSNTMGVSKDNKALQIIRDKPMDLASWVKEIKARGKGKAPTWHFERRKIGACRRHCRTRQARIFERAFSEIERPIPPGPAELSHWLGT